MILKLIDDLNCALDHNCFFSALSLALTLPDICGKAQYPTEKSTKKRYIAWYDENVGAFEKCPGEGNTMPYLSGEVVYYLRCSFLHQGNPNIEPNSIQEECCKIDQFVLVVDKKKTFNILMDSCSRSQDLYHGEQIGSIQRTYEVSVRRLCFIISACASVYYKKHKEQFNFFNFTVVDQDERYKQFSF